jgi:putative transposase
VAEPRKGENTIPRLAIENACYFVTSVVRNRAPVLQGQWAHLFRETLYDCRERYDFALLGYCIMPDHFHALLAPSKRNTISQVMRYIKGRFARLLNCRQGSDGPVWQEGFYETMVLDEAELLEKLDYMWSNPVRKGLASSPEEYEHSSARYPEKTDLAAWLGCGALQTSPHHANAPPTE